METTMQSATPIFENFEPHGKFFSSKVLKWHNTLSPPFQEKEIIIEILISILWGKRIEKSWGRKCCFLKCGGKRRLVKISLPCLCFPLWCNSFCEQSNQLLHRKPSVLLPQRSFSSPQLRKTRQAFIFYSLCASYKLNHFSNGGHSDSFWTKDSGWSEKSQG